MFDIVRGMPLKKEPCSVGVEKFPVRIYPMPLLERGSLAFINIRPSTYHGVWLCDECGERVVMSKHAAHAESHDAGRRPRRR